MEGLRYVFIRNLKFYRGIKKLRQADLSYKIGKCANYINSIENSKYFPSPETIEQIAQILGVAPMQLFNPKEPTQPKSIDKKAIKSYLEEEILKSIESAFEKLD